MRFFDTPFGRMAVAATPRGLARVFLPGDNIPAPLRGGSPDPPRTKVRAAGQETRRAKRCCTTDPAAERFEKSAEREILEYLSGRRRKFTVPLDLAGLPPFHEKVLAAARRIPYGRTATYGELAARAGSPRAARAVGQAMARNPVPLIIPCHRVVASGGGLGGFGGGLDLKRRLLDLEARARQD
jgi:methylated-DNA-[protein]-cysteine S-methyltransferase